MMLLRPPGVYRAEADTDVLIDVMCRFAAGRDVLDIGTGSGAIALAASRAGARSVTAVDLSWRSVTATRLNAALHGARITVRRGDLFDPVLGSATRPGRRFDLVVANPPYVPSATSLLPRHRIARCWDGGHDGRAVLDRICAGVPDVLAADGQVLIVHSAVCGPQRTVRALEEAGLSAQVLVRTEVPFGPVMRARAAMLEARGLLHPGQRVEELVVVEAHREQ